MHGVLLLGRLEASLRAGTPAWKPAVLDDVHATQLRAQQPSRESSLRARSKRGNSTPGTSARRPGLPTHPPARCRRRWCGCPPLVVCAGSRVESRCQTGSSRRSMACPRGLAQGRGGLGLGWGVGGGQAVLVVCLAAAGRIGWQDRQCKEWPAAPAAPGGGTHTPPTASCCPSRRPAPTRDQRLPQVAVGLVRHDKHRGGGAAEGGNWGLGLGIGIWDRGN